MKPSLNIKLFTDNVLPFKIKEDADNTYILDYTIPKANNKENSKCASKSFGLFMANGKQCTTQRNNIIWR